MLPMVTRVDSLKSLECGNEPGVADVVSFGGF
jgi:hypothetical protein